jgi:hypothetical protein
MEKGERLPREPRAVLECLSWGASLLMEKGECPPRELGAVFE